MNTKLHSPLPYFLLTALLGAVPVLNNLYPSYYFPVASSWWVEVVSVAAGVWAAYLGFKRGWAILEHRARASSFLRQAVENRRAAENPDANDVVTAGRFVSRLVRNAESDLREIKPDFTPASLDRLQRYLPVLLNEIESDEEALIRLGVVGTYLGEVLCRNFQWQWFFKPDPGLRQFVYLVSTVRKQGREMDPYLAASELFAGTKTVREIVKEAA